YRCRKRRHDRCNRPGGNRLGTFRWMGYPGCFHAFEERGAAFPGEHEGKGWYAARVCFALHRTFRAQGPHLSPRALRWLQRQGSSLERLRKPEEAEDPVLCGCELMTLAAGTVSRRSAKCPRPDFGEGKYRTGFSSFEA